MAEVKRVVVWLLLAVLLILGGVGYTIWLRVHESYRGYAGPEQYVEIPQGVGTKAIGERLIAAGIVRDALTYRVALWLSGDARRLQAGEYRFDRPMTPLEILGKIARGEVDVVAVTFP